MIIKHWLKTGLLLGVLTGILLGIGWLIGGYSGLTYAIVFSVLMNLGSYFFSDKIVLAIYRAKEAKKSEYSELHKIVEEVSLRAGIPKPRVYIIPTDAPNAFATGRNPKNAVVACTEGIIKLLSKEELRGVLAHEVSHVKNRDILVTTIAATIAGVISYVAFMLRWAAIFGGGSRDREGGNALGLLVLTVITPIIAMMLQLAISRSREYLADASGATTIKASKPLASALQKLEQAARQHPLRFGSPATSSLFIVNPFRGQALVQLLSTHPSTEERVKRLNEMKF